MAATDPVIATSILCFLIMLSSCIIIAIINKYNQNSQYILLRRSLFLIIFHQLNITIKNNNNNRLSYNGQVP